MKVKYELGYLNDLIRVGYVGTLGKVTFSSNLEVTLSDDCLSLEFSPSNSWWKRYGTLLSIHRLLVVNRLGLRQCSFPYVEVSNSNHELGICKLYLRFSNSNDWLRLVELLGDYKIIDQGKGNFILAYAGPLSRPILQLLINLVRPYFLELFGQATLSGTSSITLDVNDWFKVSKNSQVESDVIHTLLKEGIELRNNLMLAPSFLAWDRESALDCLWSHWLREGKVKALPPITLNVSSKVLDWLRYNGYECVEHPRIEYVNKFNQSYYQDLSNVELGYPVRLDEVWLDSQVSKKLFTHFQNINNERLISVAFRFKQRTLRELIVSFQEQLSEMVWMCMGVKPKWLNSTLTVNDVTLTKLRLTKVYVLVTFNLDQLSFSSFYPSELKRR